MSRHWRSGRGRGMQAYKVCSLSLFLLSFILNVTRRVCPPHRVIPSFLTWRGGSALLVLSFLHSQCDEEGLPSLSCHSFLFDVTRRIHPPCPVIPSFSMWWGGSILAVSFPYFWYDKEGPSSSLCYSFLFDTTRRVCPARRVIHSFYFRHPLPRLSQ